MRFPSRHLVFGVNDAILLMWVAFVSFGVRAHRIAYPSARVFDEVHFGGFVNDYLRHKSVEDIHPPTGKMLLALGGMMNGYNGTIDFEQSDESYPDLHFITLRHINAFFSSLASPLLFLAMRLYGLQPPFAMLVALMVMLDSLLVIEGKLILIDGILYGFVALTIFSVCVLRAFPNSYWPCVLTAAAAALASSTKLTALGLLVFVEMQLFVQFSFRSFFKKTFVVGFVFAVVFLMSYVIHFVVNQPIQEGFILFRIFKYIRKWHRNNMHILKPHSAQSRWYEWPLVLMKAIPFYTNHGLSLVLHPNPLIWYLALTGVILMPFTFNKEALVWLGGYFSSLLPFAFIKRSVFVYHYIIPLIFGCNSLGIALQVFLQNFAPASQRAIGVVLCGMVIASFIFFAPWCYAMQNVNWEIRTWRSDLF